MTTLQAGLKIAACTALVEYFASAALTRTMPAQLDNAGPLQHVAATRQANPKSNALFSAITTFGGVMFATMVLGTAKAQSLGPGMQPV